MTRPFIPAPNCASVELIYLAAGQIIENTFHVQKSSPYSFADLQALRGLFNTWDQTTVSGIRASTTVLTRIRTKSLDASNGDTEDYTLPVPRAGSAGAAALPLNVTFCLRCITNSAGRSYRGRIYFAGIPSNYLGATINEISASWANTMVSYLTNFKATLLAAGHTMVVVSYRNNKAWRTTAAATAITQWGYADLYLDSQRRRLSGRGT